MTTRGAGAFPRVKTVGTFTWQFLPIRIKNSCYQIAFPNTHTHGKVSNCYTNKLLGQTVSSSPKCPHLHWGPSNNVFNCYCFSLSRIKRPEPVKYYPFPFMFEVNHSWSYASGLHVRLNGTVLNQHKKKFTWARGYFLLGNIQTCCGANPTSHSTQTVFLSLD